MLTKIVQALGRVKGIRGLHEIHIDNNIVYYNRPPGKISKLVFKLSKTVPHPDIVISKQNEVLIVEAKYREHLSQLELKESLRLLGYITDLARNETLKAIIACLSKTVDYYTAPLNDKQINIIFVEVNPQMRQIKL